MRHLKLLTIFSLTACMPAQQAEVTKSSPLEASVGISLPAAQTFAATPVSGLTRGNAEMGRDFLDLVFRMESGRALPVLSRFEGTITVGIAGDAPATAKGELSRLINRFRNEAGLDVQLVGAGETPSINVEFQTRSAMQKVVPNAACFVVPRVTSFADYKAKRQGPEVDWTTVTQRKHVSIFVPSDTSPQEVRDCLNEEMAQAIGPLNDLYHVPDSVFNDDNFNSVLTRFDMLMLRVQYSDALQRGMNEAEVASRVPQIMSRLNPAGDSKAAQIKTVAPRAWVQAVEGAFAGRASIAARVSAADRMIAIAAAQGWKDGRLAFGYYARGRALITKDPARAVADFADANKIYRAIPGAAIQAAHVDMQLAAIALSTGQAAQAIDFANRAIPVVKQAQNAALLATLMLIKAEAYENLGQAAEARAERLDSLGWARYGFGAEQQVRARMSEISALGARGKRG